MHGKGHGLTRRVLRLAVLVPGGEDAIRAEGSEGSVLFVEGDIVYSVDLSLPGLRLLLLSMALKTEVSVVDCAKVLAREVVILDAASAFDGPYSVAFAVAKNRDSARCESERRLYDIVRVKLLLLENFVQVPGVD